VKKLRDTVYRLLWNRATFHFQVCFYAIKRLSPWECHAYGRYCTCFFHLHWGGMSCQTERFRNVQQAQNYKSSSSFFAATYQFASPELEQSKVARFCALSHVGLREWERWDRYLDLMMRNIRCVCVCVGGGGVVGDSGTSVTDMWG
jgi:hypothetical protein